MRKLAALIILGALLLASVTSAHGAAPSADWPSLDYDAAHSNYNSGETTLTVHNVLKLKVKWIAPETNVSYPVVAAGKVYVPVLAGTATHIAVLNATTGKTLGTFSRDALGGLLINNDVLYAAGHALQALDPATGERIARMIPSPSVKGSVFLNPVTDGKHLVVGYTVPRGAGSLYSVNPTSDQLGPKMASSSGVGALTLGRILTQTLAGSASYDESNGKSVWSRAAVKSNWFAGSVFAYTVASVRGKNTTIYAFDGTGDVNWSRTVASPLAVSDWPHAVTPSAVYIQVLRPSAGIEALDPLTGRVLWSRGLSDVEHIVVANGVLYALTYGLGQPVRLVTLRADTGAPIGAIVLSSSYFAFPAVNGLMVADGMVFIRAVTGAGTQLLLGLGL
jgi:hypothetical protein